MAVILILFTDVMRIMQDARLHHYSPLVCCDRSVMFNLGFCVPHMSGIRFRLCVDYAQFLQGERILCRQGTML